MEKWNRFTGILLICTVGGLLLYVYQQLLDNVPLPINLEAAIWVLGIVVLLSFYIWTISAYFRRWYAYIVTPILTLICFFSIGEIVYGVLRWVGHPSQDTPLNGLMQVIGLIMGLFDAGKLDPVAMLSTVVLFATSLGGFFAVIVGSTIGTSLGLFIEFRQTNKDS